jgi:hypothetical protein
MDLAKRAVALTIERLLPTLEEPYHSVEHFSLEDPRITPLDGLYCVTHVACSEYGANEAVLRPPRGLTAVLTGLRNASTPASFALFRPMGALGCRGRFCPRICFEIPYGGVTVIAPVEAVIDLCLQGKER